MDLFRRARLCGGRWGADTGPKYRNENIGRIVIFIRFEQRLQFFGFTSPFRRRWRREHLWNAAPADIPDEQTLLVVCCGAVLQLQLPKETDRSNVVPEFLFERTVTETVLNPDAVIPSV